MARAAKPARTGRKTSPQATRTRAAGAKASPPAPPESKRASPPGKKRTTEIDRVIGAKLRLRRGELGITQTQLANAIGVTFQQVQKYEQGTNRIGGSRLAGIAKALDVPVSYFFDQSSEETEVASASLLNVRGAVSLLRAYAAIREPHQRQAMVNLARAMAGEEPLEEGDEVH
jgi:transcriptional regulator with XRE-family HTH domain